MKVIEKQFIRGMVKVYCMPIFFVVLGLSLHVTSVQAELSEKLEECIKNEMSKYWNKQEQEGKLSDLKTASRSQSFFCCEEKVAIDKGICYETRNQAIADMASQNAFSESLIVVSSCCIQSCLEAVPDKTKVVEYSTSEDYIKCQTICMSETSHLAQTLYAELVLTYGCKNPTTP